MLTSPDPEFRTKLKQITTILSRLGPREKFFSIDEFGPCAVKRRGGVALVPADEIKTIPQRQRSKGSSAPPLLNYRPTRSRTSIRSARTWRR